MGGNITTPKRSCGLLTTLFIAYHLVALLIANLPSQGPTQGLRWIFAHYGDVGLYLESTGSIQSWTLFGPDLPRTNEYMRVLVRDQNGAVTDLRHDTYGRQQYPYLRFDYMRTVNFRLAKAPAYRPRYAAWVCRAWEATHRGQSAVEVHFVRLSTRIPAPSEAYATMGYDPMALPVEEADAGSYACAGLPDGRLPPYLRRRLGLPPGS